MRALKRGEVTLLQKGYLYNNTHPVKRSCVVERKGVRRNWRERGSSVPHSRFISRERSAEKHSLNYL
jgi:hypothetical protein